jgi:cytochrome c oxidase subunit 2
VLRADQPDEHHTQCAEFCGRRHADMKLLVVAEPADRFDSWISERAWRRRRPSPPARDPLITMKAAENAQSLIGE